MARNDVAVVGDVLHRTTTQSPSQILRSSGAVTRAGTGCTRQPAHAKRGRAGLNGFLGKDRAAGRSTSQDKGPLSSGKASGNPATSVTGGEGGVVGTAH